MEFTNSLERGHHALEKAKQQFSSLTKVENLELEEIYWNALLLSIDVIRQALIETFKSDKELHSVWYSGFASDFKNDPLLVYMRNARNNVGHIVTKKPITNNLGLSIKDKEGKNFSLDSITSTLKDGVLKIELEADNLPGDIKLECDAFNSKAIALPVINAGKKYKVPHIHNGCILASNEITHFADITLTYYCGILDKASSQIETI